MDINDYNFLVTMNGHQEILKDLDSSLSYIRSNWKDNETTLADIRLMAKDNKGCLNFSINRDKKIRGEEN